MPPYFSTFLATFYFVFTLYITQVHAGPISSSACSSSLLGGLGCLSDASLAKTACSSVLGVAKTTVTVSTTTVSYATVTATADATTSAASEDADTLTLTSTASVSGGTSVSYSITIYTKSFTATTTTYVDATPTPAAAKRQLLCLTALDPLLSSLSLLGPSSASTACSCLGFTQNTKTLTATATFASSSTTTVQAGPAATTTAASLTASAETTTVTITTTTGPATTKVVTVSTTTSITKTSTVFLAAPTYTQVYGPQTGCSDDTAVGSQNLDNTITDQDVAVRKCEAICDQHSDCSFLYVQHMFTNYGSSIPYWTCYWNNHYVDEESDLICGRDTGIYGTAVGFNALGRGKA
ncbi:hypothetical protein K431DRAFT_309361 [Polychaeton citri CBS 116435]|uniref:Apple domain-containing protein n=1 Tax=Polychaeton citri CBS 116435 TaxID=1314669 RepID=A0A9P4QG36_9PEZI|nr:hypothetical protein K431DRAFT_309361 [Polychaeton citri CBS 116435]